MGKREVLELPPFGTSAGDPAPLDLSRYRTQYKRMKPICILIINSHFGIPHSPVTVGLTLAQGCHDIGRSGRHNVACANNNKLKLT